MNKVEKITAKDYQKRYGKKSPKLKITQAAKPKNSTGKLGMTTGGNIHPIVIELKDDFIVYLAPDNKKGFDYWIEKALKNL
jgi:hypothetical protein